MEVFKGITKLPRQASSSLRPPSAGPSSANHARPKSPTIMNMQKSQHDHIPTDTDSDDSDDHKRETQIPIVGEYDPTAYENLIVNDDVKELFQFITKYNKCSKQLVVYLYVINVLDILHNTCNWITNLNLLFPNSSQQWVTSMLFLKLYHQQQLYLENHLNQVNFNLVLLC